MQFKGKFMIQTQENGAKPHFCPGSRPLGRNLSRHFFVPSYHRMQFQGKSMIQTHENCKKFWARFSHVRPKFRSPIFFLKNLTLSVTRYYGQLSSCTISKKNWTSLKNGQHLTKKNFMLSPF